MFSTIETVNDEDPTPTEMEIDGTDIVEDVRRRQCTANLVQAMSTITLLDVVDGETLMATVRIERRASGPTLVFSDSSGTVLVLAETRLAEDPVQLDASESAAVEFPVEFVVNRCDPHAIAEITKRYGLDLHVEVDGARAVPVPVDIGTLVPQLEEIVERCRTTGEQ